MQTRHHCDRAAATWAILVILALGSVVPTAHATLAPRVNVEILGGPLPAEAGMVYAGTFRVTTEFAADFESFDAPPNPCYETLLLDAPQFVHLEDGEHLDIPFSFLAGDPTCGPLTLAFDLDGATASFSWDLSPESFAEGTIDQPLLQLATESAAGKRSALAGLAVAPPVPAPPAALLPGDEPHDHDESTKADRNIRVRGRIVYARSAVQDVGADGSSVYVYDGSRLFALTSTDPDGYFDVTFPWYGCFFCGSPFNPQLRVVFSSENTKVSLQNSSNKRLRWETKTWSNYAGTDLDVGVWTPADKDQPYLHALTVLTRCWRLVLDDAGLDAVQVKCTYPNPDPNAGPFYWAAGDRIFMNKSRIWLEVTLGHEYGHHITANHAADSATNYCNGVCDKSAKECGHCTWCVESETDAWNEGFASYVADALRRRHVALYGVSFIDQLRFDRLALCNGSGALDSPPGNEGAFVACLADIEDADNEDDTLTAEVSGWRDVLTLGTDEIWTVALQDLPKTPLQFLHAFLARYPQHAAGLWETGKNNGFDLDLQAPGAPPAFISTSHQPGVPSPDGTITMIWSGAPDDCSGIAGYSLRATLDAPALPSASQVVGNVNAYTTFQLPAGNWYLTIRAVDRAGRWSGVWASAGPFVIQPPQPADLAAVTLPGWAHPVVPRPAADVDLSSVPAPASLTAGNQTWWNLGLRNVGGQATTGTVFQDLYIDGVLRDYGTIGGSFPVGPNGTMGFLNYGPLDVGGGRHTFGGWIDGREALPEAGEADNLWAKQWTWAPSAFPLANRRERAAPPLRTGGWNALGAPATGWNLDGLRVTTNLGFYGVWMHALDNQLDYDLELHSFTGGGETGFDTWLASSAHLGGRLDAVLWNRTVARDQAFDLGVVNYSGGSSDYAIEFVAASEHTFGSTAVGALAQGRMMMLRTVAIAAGQTGPVSVTVAATPASAPLRVAWFDAAFAAGGIGQASSVATTGSGGAARLDLQVATAGTCFLAIYRDPSDGADPVTVSLEVGTTKPDLLTFALPGWHAPLVPRPASDGTVGSVPAPTVLVGDLAPTWFNYALANASLTASPPTDSTLLLDGASLATVPWPALPAYTFASQHPAAGHVVRAGRHTASWRLDTGAAATESDETNNRTGGQWTWMPPLLAAGVPVTRSAPPDRTGGWEDIPDPLATPLWFNCDGLRIDTALDPEHRSGYWQAVAVLPGPASDVDIRLHEAAASPLDGFGNGLTLSGWGTGASDYVLVNFNRTTRRPFDAGVVNAGGDEPYTAHHALSTWLGNDPAGSSGPFTLGTSRIANLHEVRLSPGNYIVRLRSLNGLGDLGLTFHPGEMAYLAKSVTVAGGSSWEAPAGGEERLLLTIDVTRHNCLAVWRVGATDLADPATYTLEFQAVSAVEAPQVPAAAGIVGTWPNPFNPRLTVAFDLPRAESAVLAVYGVDGRLVRSLLHDHLDAGRHEVVWDGQDDAGRRAASGVYFVRLQAGLDGLHLARVTLLK